MDKHPRPITAGIIDSHFHSLEMQGFDLDPVELLTHSFDQGMEWAIDVTVTPEDFDRRQALTAPFPKILLTSGIYPSEAHRFVAAERDALIAGLRAALDHPKVVAIGEIGLDSHLDACTFAEQQELLRSQLAVAAEQNLPVIIHNRDRDAAVWDSLHAAGLPRAGIMHCFSSDYAAARRFLDLGFAISFAGNLTYKSSHELHDAARRLPLDSLLVETDSPFLAPHPVRGRPNHPANVAHTYAYLAQLRGIPVETLIEAVKDNFLRLIAPPGATQEAATQ